MITSLNSTVQNSGYFDIVIGNPPYLKEGKISKSIFKQYKKLPYYQGKLDLWYMFACECIDLLKNNRFLCFIATNNWVTSSGAKKLRNKIISDTQMKHIVDFGKFLIFEKASIQTMIMLFSKNSKIDNYILDLRKLTGDTKLADVLDLLNNKINIKAQYLFPQIIKQNLINKLLTFSLNDAILDKISDNCLYSSEKEVANGIHPHYNFINKKLSLIYNLEIGTGIFGLSNKEKIELKLSKKEISLIKPYYTTKQIHKYYTDPENKLWLIYTNSNFNNPRSMDNYPNLKKHLDKFKKIITSDNKPYGLHRAREERFFKDEKIIVQRKCVGTPSFSYSNFDCYVSATFYIIKTNRFNIKYLIGLLNSKLIAFWLKNKGKMQGNNFQIDKEPLLQIPIFNANIYQQKPIIELVDKILKIKEGNIKADTDDMEQKIDLKIYEFYKLSNEEIEIIENN